MRIVVIGGGTATNAIAPVFAESVYEVTYILPISDNGGSTSEILRFFGGPAIGDLRSRLVRLIEVGPLRKLLGYRLSDNDTVAANDWSLIVAGSHEIWTDIEPQIREMYRAFAIYIHSELLKKSAIRKFDFRNASVGNLILSGARLFFGSLDSAVEFVLRTARVQPNMTVIPCINNNQTSNIAAVLANGSVVIGQTEISHPTLDTKPTNQAEDTLEFSFAHPSLQASQISFSKSENAPLPCPIDRVFYVNLYGNEIKPSLYARAQNELQTSEAVICSIGSLYTSIIPVLILQKFGFCAPSQFVLILNGTSDRETEGMKPEDFIVAINRAIAYSKNVLLVPQKPVVTDVIYPSGKDVSVISEAGINVFPAECAHGEYNLESLSSALKLCLFEKKRTGLISMSDLS